MLKPITCSINIKGNNHKRYCISFLEMARKVLVAANPEASIWYVPCGMAHKHNLHDQWGYGKNDKRIDLDPECEPDFLCDVRELDEFFRILSDDNIFSRDRDFADFRMNHNRPDAIIINLGYYQEFAKYYTPGSDKWISNLKKLFKDCMRIVKPAGLVGVLDVLALLLGKDFEQLYNISVIEDNKQMRYFSVWQNIADRRILQ